MRQIACVATLLLTPGLLLAAPVPSATGLWKVDGDVTGRPVKMMCALTETDSRLSGTCSGAADGYKAHQVTGKVKAQKLQFYFQISFAGNPITLIVSGRLNDDSSKIDGDLDVEPMSLGGFFAAVRQPDYAAPAAAAPAGPAQTVETTQTPAATPSGEAPEPARQR